jgi:hypothetical protein
MAQLVIAGEFPVGTVYVSNVEGNLNASSYNPVISLWLKNMMRMRNSSGKFF